MSANSRRSSPKPRSTDSDLSSASAWSSLGLFEDLPPGLREALEGQYRHSVARSMARYHQLGLLLKQFANLGIPVITLKGAYLAKAVYAGPRAPAHGRPRPALSP